MTVSGRLAAITLLAAAGMGVVLGLANSPGTDSPGLTFPGDNETIYIVAVSNNIEAEAPE